MGQKFCKPVYIWIFIYLTFSLSTEDNLSHNSFDVEVVKINKEENIIEKANVLGIV